MSDNGIRPSPPRIRISLSSCAGVWLVILFVFMFPPSPLYIIPHSPGCNCTIEFTSAPQRPIPGEGVQFTSVAALQDCDSMIPVTGYAWDFGDGETSTLPNPVHAYASVGTYTVRQVVTLGNGETCKAEKEITVIGTGGCNCTATFATTPDHPSPGEEVRFAGRSTIDEDCADDTGTDWAWDFTSDGSVDSHEQNPSYRYAGNGSFMATLTVTRDGYESNLSKEVVVGGNISPSPEAPSRSNTMLPAPSPTLVPTDTIPPSSPRGNTSEIPVAAETTVGRQIEDRPAAINATDGMPVSAGNSSAGAFVT